MIGDIKRLERFATFCLDLSHLLKVGLPFSNAIQALKSQEPSNRHRQALQALENNIQNGKPVMEQLAHLLPDYIPFPCRHQQSIPNMPDFLADIADIYGRKASALKQGLRHLRYPAFLGLTACLILMVFFKSLLPSINAMLLDSGTTPPLTIVRIQTFANVLSSFAWDIMLICLLWYVTLGKKVYQQLAIRLYAQLFPFTLADLCTLLALHLKQGLSMAESLSHITVPAGNKMSKAFPAFKKDVLQGEGFSICLNRHFQLDAMAMATLSAAEKSGTLAAALFQIGTMIKKREERRQEQLLSATQPAALLLIGLLVMGIIYLSVLPMLIQFKQII